jgi:hypothetical protein
MFLINIAAYYKDITNQPGWIYYQNLNTSVHYYKASNSNYADIRGFEFTVTKLTGPWISGFINYTYHVSTSGYFGLTQYYQDVNKQRDYLALNPYQTKPHPQPFARANLVFTTPNDFGPLWMDINPLGGWSLNILADWRAGSYATYNPYGVAGVVDNVQWADWYNVDIRFSKSLQMLGFDLMVYMDVENLFNFKHLNYAGFADNYDYQDYLASLCFSWMEGDKKGEDRIGDYRPNGVAFDPLEPNPNKDPVISARNQTRKDKKSYIDMPNISSITFLNPRSYTFGFRFSF